MRRFPDDPAERQAMLERMNQAMVRGVPFNAALGVRVLDFDKGEATVLLPFRPDLVGDPSTGVLAGGIITSVVDASSGLAVFLRLERLTRIATLDLRIDYLRPARPSLDVKVHAECYRATRQIAFTRAVAYHGDDLADPVATSAGTFMIFDEGASPLGDGTQPR
jgi:uncharacterized protein (TIGR00369 family)